MSDPQHKVPTHLRALRIAEVVAEEDGPISQVRIAERLGLAKQTVNRLCKNMLIEGYLVTVDGGKRLRPGRRLRSMATGLLDSSRFHIARRQIMRTLAETVGETVNFVVPTDDGMIYLDRVETDWSLRIQLPIGSHVPFHCTASGKTFLASLPTRERGIFVRSLTLTRHTPSTLTDPEALLEALTEIEEQGYATDDQELMESMVAVAAPLHDAKGRYVASLAFHGPMPRLTLDGALARRDALFSAVDQLQDTLTL